MQSRALFQTYHGVPQRYGAGEMILTFFKIQTKCVFFLGPLTEMNSFA